MKLPRLDIFTIFDGIEDGNPRPNLCLRFHIREFDLCYSLGPVSCDQNESNPIGIHLGGRDSELDEAISLQLRYSTFGDRRAAMAEMEECMGLPRNINRLNFFLAWLISNRRTRLPLEMIQKTVEQRFYGSPKHRFQRREQQSGLFRVHPPRSSVRLETK